MKIIRAGFSVMLALSAYGQGPLLPPGAPGPTMKTLAQVEPRTAITNAPVTISQPGSYYLATNVAGTITLDADHVTLDLMGFRVAAPSGSGIVIPAGKGKHTVVRNGVIRMATAAYGVDGRYIQDGNSRFENLLIDGNDVAWCGLSIGSGCLIRDCDIRNCNNNGIIGNSTYGGLEVRDCRITGGTLDGVTVYKNSRVVDNVIEGNEDAGLVLVGTGTFVAGNLVRANGDNYNLAAGNQLNLLLDQIPETLDWPCSVKLAGTLICAFAASNGITVNSDDVTIDLAGHALVGPGATSGHGISQGENLTNLRVMNGQVRNWRATLRSGIDVLGKNNQLEHLQCVSNYNGLVCGNGGTVMGCTASYNANDGLYATYACVMSKCVATYNGDAGLRLDSRCNLFDSVAIYNTGDGILASYQNRIANNVADFNGYGGGDGAGVHLSAERNCVVGNSLTQNDRGLEIDLFENYVADNTVRNNTENYAISSSENQLNLLLCEVPEILNWPCAVKFAGTLKCTSTVTNGITVNANDVTIDMAGHALIGPGASGMHGISQDQALSNLRILNGQVRNWRGTARNGINAMGKNGQVENLQCLSNYNGLAVATGGKVTGCAASYNSNYGIYGVYGCLLSDCVASYNTAAGFYLEEGCGLSDCVASYNTGHGIRVASDCVVRNNACDSNGYGGTGAGVYISGNDNRIEGNNLTDNDVGLNAAAAGNLIVRNSASGNTTNWTIAANNKVGPIVSAPNSVAINGDTGGAGVGSTDPWANLSF